MGAWDKLKIECWRDWSLRKIIAGLEFVELDFCIGLLHWAIEIKGIRYIICWIFFSLDASICGVQKNRCPCQPTSTLPIQCPTSNLVTPRLPVFQEIPADSSRFALFIFSLVLTFSPRPEASTSSSPENSSSPKRRRPFSTPQFHLVFTRSAIASNHQERTPI